MSRVGVKISCKECDEEFFKDPDIFKETIFNIIITIADLEKWGMKIKFSCNECGEEIFQDMDKNMKETETVADVLQKCVCSDCLLKQARKNNKR